MAYAPVSVIEVYAWDSWVGAIALNPDTGFYAFAYTDEWQETGIELAPLHLPVRDEPYEFPSLSPQTFYRLPALFADALPDKFGNALVDAWMAENGVVRTDVTPLDRLAYAGDRAMGALTFLPPADPALEAPGIVQVADLVLAARGAVRGDASTSDGLTDALRQLIQVGTSAGGARAKAVVLYNRDTGQIRSGHAPREPGFVDYILKLDGVGDVGMDGHVDGLAAGAPYGRIEFAYYLMAIASGITMEESTLLREGPRAHFLTRRFDRDPDGRRHHIITLCAIAHLDFNLAGAHSYDQYLDTVRELGLDSEAVAQAYRRMVFNVAAVNRDDHTKNLSFLRREDGGWELAPAYDVAYAHNPAGGWTQRHQMRVNGETDDITVDDLYAVGDRHDVPAYKRIVRDVLDAVGIWRECAATADVPEEETAQIADDMQLNRPR